MARTPLAASIERSALAERYRAVRRFTAALADPLSPEDMTAQAAPEASPTKWHLAHTTWFFETFVLEPHEPGFEPYDAAFRVLFNSYYHGVGARHPRARRGLLTRPGAGEVLAYRDTVDERLLGLLERSGEAVLHEIEPLIEIGLQHEQQHQELILTDIKLLLHANPVRPAYRVGGAGAPIAPAGSAPALGWAGYDGGVVEIGWAGDGFAYDNESPRHRRFLEPYELADRLVTNGEFASFIGDGGYGRPELWLDAGWSAVGASGWRAPLYWRPDGAGGWIEFTLDGEVPLAPAAPVCGLSFFEADAYARWAGARLPTEAEWEHGAAGRPVEGNFVETGLLRPAPAPADAGVGPRQCFGDVWEWTRSAHEPYPGYAPPSGAIGEYNGKFMCGAFVLRGGSCATSRAHVRAAYRNFFEPWARWQFSGLRLARSMT